MAHLGLVIYSWEGSAQNRLLSELVGPAARDLCRTGDARAFWFTRFDARGPHVFATLTLAPGSGPARALRERLAERVAAFLAPDPDRSRSAGPAGSGSTLAARHAACRGKWMCALDRKPGMAREGTFAVFSHPAGGYPFSLAGRPSARPELWRLLDDLSFWTIARLDAPVTAALRWIAGLERQLAASCPDAAGYWRHHLRCSLPALEARAPEAREAALAALHGRLGSNDLAACSSAWRARATSGADEWPHFAHLLQWTSLARPSGPAGAPGPDGRDRPARWALLREVVHWTLIQLGVPLHQQLPMLLYAWDRAREGERAGETSAEKPERAAPGAESAESRESAVQEARTDRA